MEQQDNSHPPDLATVLRNLAALAPPPPLQAPASGGTAPDAEYNAVAQPIPQRQYFADPRLAGRSQNPGLRQQANASTTPPPPTVTPTPQASRLAPIDPATIIEWAPGLRCISKIAARNPNLKPVVQKMIAEQHEHELIWWGGRQALVAQKATEEQLKAYDRKVHKAQTEMFNAMSGQLKGLGVPFFGVKPELITRGDEAATAGSGPASGPKARVTDVELLKLQRKMIEYLEDMYKD
ncbi:uncharacterized protein BKCO1_1000652 [Diplodia corticola]|uniref:Uncharacterized protein n=1 Tax=Diplodia corticola TaxID=236234 RepID=A0A1J9SKH7_9PEZI|nr:uncharacterized protein BKCO1_1000652 [Diplodia corticola]OJD40244.1 hypothetical protein BKCO1_1000652 [Diplodia corticola]